MAEVPPVRPGRVFLSYRRGDTAFPAGWLYERLVARFGRDAVFKDVDSIDLGDDWAEVVRTAVGSCDVLLAMIGREWATITDAVGRRRLEDPDDFVRLEIETALQRGVRVIPILVEGAGLPRAEQLPISLAKLVDRQALELSPYRFDHDITRLSYVLEETIAQQQSRRAAEEQATDRYAKAVEQLGSEKLAVRLGGIYALERLIGDSPRHYPTIVGVLAAFLRAHATTPMEETSPESSRQTSTPPVIPMPADTAAAARAIADDRDECTRPSWRSTLKKPEKWIIKRGSTFSPTAANPTSTAFGLGQLILANRRHYAGRSAPTRQTRATTPARRTRASSCG